MENFLSKSEKKRHSKSIEKLVHELGELTRKDIDCLPCEKFIKDELITIRSLKGGARKRQIKFIAKILRQEDKTTKELLSFLQNRLGSKLKHAGELHELERLRDAIIDEVLSWHDKETTGSTNSYRARGIKEHGEAIREALRRFPDLSAADLQNSAFQFARTRKIVHSREIFRMLRSALERQKY